MQRNFIAYTQTQGLRWGDPVSIAYCEELRAKHRRRRINVSKMWDHRWEIIGSGMDFCPDCPASSPEKQKQNNSSRVSSFYSGLWEIWVWPNGLPRLKMCLFLICALWKKGVSACKLFRACLWGEIRGKRNNPSRVPSLYTRVDLVNVTAQKVAVRRVHSYIIYDHGQ